MSFISTSPPLARALAERNYSEPTPVQNAVLEAAAAERLGAVEQGLADGEAIGDGLAGAGLRGDQEVAPAGGILDDGALHRRRVGVIAIGERARERRAREGKRHAIKA